jgi:hypothetical protein
MQNGDGNPEGCAATSPSGPARLAALITEDGSCDLQEIQECLHEAMVADPGVTDLIDKAVAAMDSRDTLESMKHLRKIATATRLAKLILSLQGGHAGLSIGHAQLAVLIAEIKSCDPRAVLERVRDATATDPVLIAPIAEAVAAIDSDDELGALQCVRKIMTDAKLVKMILPSRRRPRRPDVVTYRVRLDLRGTKPPLWRRLELASDLFLNQVNQVIQWALNWTDTHLHHFASGSGPYGPDTEAYLCPYEVKAGKVGFPEREVRLDEVLVDVGDKLFYTYDYGDGWKLVIKLEAILPRDGSAPQAVCTTGQRPNPPEDCGGVHGYEQIVTAGSVHPKNSSLTPFAPFSMKKI